MWLLPSHFRLAGGLGNQLFIYAAGIDYSLKTGKDVVYDAYDVSGSDYHHSSSISKLSATRKILKRTFWLALRRSTVSLIGSLFRKLNLVSIDFSSPELGYSQSIFDQANAMTLRGHFQTYRHLFAPEVRKEMATLLPKSISREYSDALESISASRTLSIHIRLGDYVALKDKFGLLSTSYFSEAVKTAFTQSNHLVERVQVFSDDLPGALASLEGVDFKGKSLHTFQGFTDEEELFLMAQSHLLIISNSTFAWWAGALGNPEKTVIAPAKWFKSLEDPADLYPDSWIKIPSQWI